MAFTISVSYSKQLEATVTSENRLQTMEFIKKSIVEDKADNVIIADEQVKYSGSTSIWRGSLFQSINDGIFTLIYKNNSWWLSYRINMRKLFIGTAILSSIMGAFILISGGPWWVSIAMFLWLCGDNWIINVIRHESVAANIAAGIDELIYDNKELPKQDK